MITLYQQQYHRSIRLHRKLIEKLSALMGTEAPLYEFRVVPANKVALVEATREICDSIDKILIKIKVAKEIATDSQALGHMEGRLNRIEEEI